MGSSPIPAPNKAVRTFLSEIGRLGAKATNGKLTASERKEHARKAGLASARARQLKRGY